jgi:NADPH:quinone reductase-like Zn-dependent oxidoreductase
MTGRGVSALLDYHEPLPADLDHSFDVVFDCNGSIASGDLDRMLKHGGVAVDIAIKVPKLIRSLFLSRQKLAFGSVDRATLIDVANLAGSGSLTMDIAAEVPLAEAIPMLAKLEAGESSNGKVVIIFN